MSDIKAPEIINLVSVVIPCFNAEPFIAEAINSVLSQTHPNIEIIVVDDGSTDRSIDVVKAFGDLIRLEIMGHQGACAARNRGLEISSGDFIQFLDADDTLLPKKIGTQLPFLISGQYDLVFCNGYLFGDERPQRPIKKLRDLPLPIDVDPFIYCLFNGFGTEGPLHRRSLLEKVGGFRVGLGGGQEYDLHIRLGAVGARLHKLDDYLFRHRNHNNPKRITHTPKPPGFNAEMLMGLLACLQQDSPESLTPERCQILAGRLFQSSIHAYRNGDESAAAKGFRQAKTLSNKLEYNERPLYKFIAELINPMFAEGCLKQARVFRDSLKKPFKSSLTSVA